jgi:D-alanyl-D-alanine carboxypeptidase/D-alanyl-D-alanine-endopeptidase (penicillin-binding protein 4)
MTRRAGPPAAPIVVLAAVALVPALVLFMLWRWADGRAEGGDPPPATPTPVAAPPPAAALVTPLLSFRRAAGVLARDLNVQAFQQDVAEFAGQLNPTSCVSVAVDGVEIGAAHPDVALIPASNQKLLTGAVALAVLGPDHRYTTELRGPPAAGGVVEGDVFLVGGGDPLLTSSTYPVQNDRYPVTDPTSLDAIVDALAGAGVTRITGAVRGDGSRYDDEFFAPSWSEDVHVVEAGPYDALVVNDARVTGDELKASDPAEGAARELVQLLRARGITVDGGSGVGVAPEDATVLGAVTSAPMSAVVQEMLGASDNNTAEMLVKELGLMGRGEGTRDAGLAVMQETLASWGVTGIQLADGSGLSNDNRVSCRALATVLARHTPDDALGSGLPVAGQSGTLADVFVGSPVAGRLRAKTGTLGNPPYDQDPPASKSLSGYLPVEGGGTITFALILNGAGVLADQSVYRPVWDALAATLAAYPAGPTAAELAPR